MSFFFFFFFFFNHTATTEIYTFPYTTLFRSLSHREGGATPGRVRHRARVSRDSYRSVLRGSGLRSWTKDRKSTRLNSSHVEISYAVFCLKKKKKKNKTVATSRCATQRAVTCI